MLFADDIVLCRQNHRELEEDLEIWRNALERRGLKVSRSKTEYTRVGGVDDGEELKLQEEKVKKAKNFKYLGSIVSNDGRCEEEVRRRIQAGWMSWRKVSGVLCDRKLSAKVKGKIYKSVVRPAMLYGMETVAVTERQMGKMEVAELKMVRWALGVTRKDKIRNEYVRGTAKIAKLGEKLRNVRLRWYRHVKRREEDYVGKRMMEMAVPGRRKRGRPRRRWMDLVREDMERVGAREGDEVDRVKWRLLSRLWRPRVGRSRKKKKKKSEIESILIRNPFVVNVQSLPDSIQEEFLDLVNNSFAKDAFEKFTLTKFWTKMNLTYPVVSDIVLNSLLMFPSTYLCEQGFSTLLNMKNKHQSRLNVEHDLRVCLSNTTP